MPDATSATVTPLQRAAASLDEARPLLANAALAFDEAGRIGWAFEARRAATTCTTLVSTIVAEDEGDGA